MRHTRMLTLVPAKAESAICTGITSNFQAQLCFLSTALTSFFLPVIQLKQPVTPTDTNQTATA